MIYENKDQILNTKSFTLTENALKIIDRDSFRNNIINTLANTIIFSENKELKKFCYWLTYSAGMEFNVIPASIQSLYEAYGKSEISGFTVPAINIRTLTFDIARALFRAAQKTNAAAFIFEIAESEIHYTRQRPLEYSSLVILAAIKENYQGPIFIQGDHFQINLKEFFQNEENERLKLESLIKEAISASFYNIDIDTSSLVDFSTDSLDLQQKLNYELCAHFTRYIRKIQPKNIEISIGGGIGEVGGKNSTPEEVIAFMQGYLKNIGNVKKISKLSIQTGTTHGGVIMPDGSIANVYIDFQTLENLSLLSRKKFGLAGCVQHGASTLPQEAFHKFSQHGAAEIHLATQFQNIVYDYLPLSLKEKIYTWLNENCLHEKKENWTKDQFIYRIRKKALGPFKKEIYSLSREWREKISLSLEKEFLFLFRQLGIQNTKPYIEKYVKPVKLNKTQEDF